MTVKQVHSWSCLGLFCFSNQ